MLNAALGVGIGLLVSWGTKKITEAAQRVQNVATQSKEAADAAQSATSSLKDLVNAYEELGDKSGWDTDDFDQAKDIQAEILDLAKEQGTLDEDKLSKLNLQNGKYEEQLGLLQDITAEQLEASRYELTQNKDAQGDKLVDTAKKNNRTHYLTVWSAPEMDMGDQIKNAGIDVFNKFGGYGPDDLNDADSIIDYYNEVGKALKYVIDHTTEAERAAGGTYHSLYQFLLDEQSALRDDVDSYNDSTDAINNNTNARRKLQAIDFWSDGKSNGMDVSYSFDKVNSAIETLKNTIDDFDASKLNDLLWGTNEGLTDEQAQALAALRKALTDMDFSADTDGVNAFIQALVQVGIVAQSSANGVDALAAGAQKMEDISSKMDEIQSAYKASTSAMEEYNQYGYMSLDSLQSLLTMNTEYLNCLELVNGKLQINKQSYAELLAAEYAEAAATILSNAQHEVANLTADDTAESTDGLKEKTEAEKTALENLLPALKNATAATATYSAAQEFANEVEKAGERGVDPAKLEEITNRTNTQLSLLYTNMNAALKGGQALTNQLNGFGSSSKNAGKSSSATSKSVADLSSAFDTLTKAMKEYNQYGYISADTIKSLIGVDDKFTACLTEQNGKLELNTASGTYSTVLGTFDGYEFNKKEYQIAYTPMLVNADGTIIPLLKKDITSYLKSIFSAACSSIQKDATTLQSKILELDTIGIDCTVYGNKIRVKNMIAAVEGGVHNGRTLTAADVAAISGCTEEELEKYFHGTSRYLGYSMHDLNNAWYIASRTTTGFTPKQNGFAGVTNWIAIGRWN